MWEVAHPGYGPVFNLFFWLGGDAASSIARPVAVLFHLANGWLLWRIFSIRRELHAFAATTAVFYLASPFLGDLRATLSHAPYDVFIFFYLLSIRFTTTWKTGTFALAFVCQAIGLSIETLAALEVIRWWLLYETGARGSALLRRAAPFTILVVALFISRLTWLIPYGLYTGHNVFATFDATAYLHHATANLSFFVDGLWPARFAFSLVKYDSPIISIVIAALAVAVAIARYRADNTLEGRRIAFLAVAGVAALGLGILPYAAVERDPTWQGFYARFAVASQFGVFILAGLAVDAIRGKALRAALVAAAVFVFSATQLQFAKWALYDGALTDDFERQLAAEFSNHHPELLLVHFHPESDKMLYLDRCLANYDVNVPLDVFGKRDGSFAYDANCGASLYTPDGKCGVTGFEQTTCPPKWNAAFDIDRDKMHFQLFRLSALVRDSLFELKENFGRLVVDRASGPVAAGTSG